MVTTCFSEVAFGFKHDEWQPLSYFEAGRCYIHLNDPSAARTMLTTVCRNSPLLLPITLMG